MNIYIYTYIYTHTICIEVRAPLVAACTSQTPAQEHYDKQCIEIRMYIYIYRERERERERRERERAVCLLI